VDRGSVEWLRLQGRNERREEEEVKKTKRSALSESEGKGLGLLSLRNRSSV
jgi:hypothetical protein